MKINSKSRKLLLVPLMAAAALCSGVVIRDAAAQPAATNFPPITSKLPRPIFRVVPARRPSPTQRSSHGKSSSRSIGRRYSRPESLGPTHAAFRTTAKNSAPTRNKPARCVRKPFAVRVRKPSREFPVATTPGYVNNRRRRTTDSMSDRNMSMGPGRRRPADRTRPASCRTTPAVRR